MREIAIPPEAAYLPLMDVLATLGCSMTAPCGGNGTCGKCRVKLLEGRFLTRGRPEIPLMPDESGCILACRALCPPSGGRVGVSEEKGSGLTVALTEEGERAPAAFSEKGEAAGLFPTPAAKSPEGPERSFALGALPDGESASAVGRTEGHPVVRRKEGRVLGAALDIGTTTLAAALCDIDTGRVLATASCLNPQKHFGADVINRIAAAEKGNLAVMQAVLLDSVRGLLEELLEEAGDQNSPDAGRAAGKGPRIERLAAAGNPTMLHLFCGISPAGMGRYPFTPAFLEERNLSGESLTLPVGSVTVLPSASAFLGSDVIGGGAVLGMTLRPDPTLLMDIGTNGEILLYTGRERGGRLLGASAAAGPALEGAGITCGMGGVRGAVSSLRKGRAPGTFFVFRTVEDAPAAGICGSGLIDLAALLLDDGTIEETGRLAGESYALRGIFESASGAVLTDTPVRLTAGDVRELQLAKSAIRAGVETLLHEAGLSAIDLGAVYLAGGLGYYLNPVSAARIGLLPEAPLSRVRAVGNTALSASIAALTSPEAGDRMRRMAAACETCELNAMPFFAEAFMEYMLFPEPDA